METDHAPLPNDLVKTCAHKQSRDLLTMQLWGQAIMAYSKQANNYSGYMMEFIKLLKVLCVLWNVRARSISWRLLNIKYFTEVNGKCLSFLPLFGIKCCSWVMKSREVCAWITRPFNCIKTNDQTEDQIILSYGQRGHILCPTKSDRSYALFIPWRC